MLRRVSHQERDCDSDKYSEPHGLLLVAAVYVLDNYVPKELVVSAYSCSTRLPTEHLFVTTFCLLECQPLLSQFNRTNYVRRSTTDRDLRSAMTILIGKATI